MQAIAMNDIGAIEMAIEENNSIAEKLNSLFQIEAPTKPFVLCSDCCSSNNYNGPQCPPA